MSSMIDGLKDGLAGKSDAELFYSQEREMFMKAFRGEIASVTDSDNKWVSARIVADTRLGSAFTEKMNAEAIRTVIDQAGENAAFTDKDPGNTLFDKPETGDFDGRSGDLGAESADQKKAKTLAAEQSALDHDPRIVNVPYCYYFENEGATAIANSYGLGKGQSSSSCGAFVMVMATEGDETQTGAEFAIAADPSQLDMIAAANTASQRALAKLGAKEIESGEYAVAFDNQTASELLGAFIASPVSPFYGENIQKGRSMLADKLGQKIGSDLLTVLDDPKRGLNPVFFDGDGVAVHPFTLVENGIFRNIVHSVYSAAREEGAETTGHAKRGRSGVSTGLHHPYLENGTGTLDELVKEMGRGILVTEMAGLHAGLNPVTGDFSLSAKGFWIEGGARAYPIRNAVVAGNFFDLATRLIGKAGDLKDDTRGGIDAPSVLIETLSVSGK